MSCWELKYFSFSLWKKYRWKEFFILLFLILFLITKLKINPSCENHFHFYYFISHFFLTQWQFIFSFRNFHFPIFHHSYTKAASRIMESRFENIKKLHEKFKFLVWEISSTPLAIHRDFFQFFLFHFCSNNFTESRWKNNFISSRIFYETREIEREWVSERYSITLMLRELCNAMVNP